jgi:hypothetical protein
MDTERGREFHSRATGHEESSGNRILRSAI